jgi:hypothetical protein
MRVTGALLSLALAAAAPALAQSNQGQVGLDAMIAPTTSLGVAFYVTDGLSVRPWLGLGYSDYSGFYASLGTQLRYELRARNALSPYLSASAQYSHYGNTQAYSAPAGAGAVGQPLTLASDLGQIGCGVGVRYRVSDSLAFFGEGRVMYATAPMGAAQMGWTTVGVNDHTRVDAMIGLTYLLGGSRHGHP